MSRLLSLSVLSLSLLMVGADTLPPPAATTQSWEQDPDRISNDAVPQLVKVSIKFSVNSVDDVHPLADSMAAAVTVKGAANTKYHVAVWLDADYAYEMCGTPYALAAEGDVTTGQTGAGLNYATGFVTVSNDNLTRPAYGWSWVVTLTDPATGAALDRTPDNYYPAP